MENLKNVFIKTKKILKRILKSRIFLIMGIPVLILSSCLQIPDETKIEEIPENLVPIKEEASEEEILNTIFEEAFFDNYRNQNRKLPVVQSYEKFLQYKTEIFKNSKGEFFLSFPNERKNTKEENFLFLRDFFNSPLDNLGIENMINVARNNNINPTVPFCIAVADSELGTKGKGNRTKNPCNVGNTDSGRTMTFHTFKDGLEGCVMLLTKPQYSNVNELWQTSTGGRLLIGSDNFHGDWNSGDKVWATSTENHIINMLRCVEYIEGNASLNYPVRIIN